MMTMMMTTTIMINKKIKIFIAMQPDTVEMIQDNFTTLQNTK